MIEISWSRADSNRRLLLFNISQIQSCISLPGLTDLLVVPSQAVCGFLFLGCRRPDAYTPRSAYLAQSASYSASMFAIASATTVSVFAFILFWLLRVTDPTATLYLGCKIDTLLPRWVVIAISILAARPGVKAFSHGLDSPL